jgi:hypothetical protein
MSSNAIVEHKSLLSTSSLAHFVLTMMSICREAVTFALHRDGWHISPFPWRLPLVFLPSCANAHRRRRSDRVSLSQPRAFINYYRVLQVAWMHFEQSAILTVHNHVITRNPRISVSHDKHRTWFLHINNVQEEDKGRYMCQINTVQAKTQFGYLHVVGEF